MWLPAPLWNTFLLSWQGCLLADVSRKPGRTSGAQVKTLKSSTTGACLLPVDFQSESPSVRAALRSHMCAWEVRPGAAPARLRSLPAVPPLRCPRDAPLPHKPRYCSTVMSTLIPLSAAAVLLGVNFRIWFEPSRNEREWRGRGREDGVRARGRKIVAARGWEGMSAHEGWGTRPPARTMLGYILGLCAHRLLPTPSLPLPLFPHAHCFECVAGD